MKWQAFDALLLDIILRLGSVLVLIVVVLGLITAICLLVGVVAILSGHCLPAIFVCSAR